MRLYAICKNCGKKIYLIINFTSRKEIAGKYGERLSITCMSCNSKSTYSVNEIFAESSVSNVPAGVIIGGLIGLIGGPLGAMVGGGIGASLGGTSDAKEIKRVNRFNMEKV